MHCDGGEGRNLQKIHPRIFVTYTGYCITLDPDPEQDQDPNWAKILDPDSHLHVVLLLVPVHQVFPSSDPRPVNSAKDYR